MSGDCQIEPAALIFHAIGPVPRPLPQAFFHGAALRQILYQKWLTRRVQQLRQRFERKMVKVHAFPRRQGSGNKLDKFQIDHRRAMAGRHRVSVSEKSAVLETALIQSVHAARRQHDRLGLNKDCFALLIQKRRAADAAFFFQQSNALQPAANLYARFQFFPPCPLDGLQIQQHPASGMVAEAARQADAGVVLKGNAFLSQNFPGAYRFPGQPFHQPRIHAGSGAAENFLLKLLSVLLVLREHHPPRRGSRIKGRTAFSRRAFAGEKHLRPLRRRAERRPNPGGPSANDEDFRFHTYPFTAPAVRPSIR